MATIGAKIKNARETRNLSQEYVAAMLEITQATYSRFESDLIKPDIYKLKQLAELLCVDGNYFFAGLHKPD